MKRLSNLVFIALFSSALFIVGCDDDNSCDNSCPAGQTLTIDCQCIDTSDPCDGITCPDGQVLTADCDCVTPNEETTVVVSENITSDVTWTADKCWVLGGRITVVDGATLTIEPGTIIKGEAGAEENATALLIARGGKIMAEGTATQPIIFTSVADEITSGQIASPNLNPSLNGLWGGVIILGKAPISADADAVQIEGIPPSDQNGLYGGTVADDNSGVFQYVSIRHGGTDIGEGNEINGLTLGGVGSGTVIDHVEVVSNVDDGIEFFGGTVNATNLIVWNQGDDAIDCDQSYSGTVDNFITIAGSSSDHSLELDGPEGARLGSFTLTNGSCKGYNDEGTGGGEYADFRADVMCDVNNVYFFNYSDNSDVELDNEGVSENWTDGTLTVSALEFNVSHLTEGNLTIEDIFVDKSSMDAFAGKAPDANVVTSRTVGADASEFANWSLSSAMNQLSDF